MKFGSHHRMNQLTDSLLVLSSVLLFKEYTCLCNIDITQAQMRQDINRGNANIDAFLCPEVLTPIEEDYMYWHNQLYHLPQIYTKRMS